MIGGASRWRVQDVNEMTPARASATLGNGARVHSEVDIDNVGGGWDTNAESS